MENAKELAKKGQFWLEWFGFASGREAGNPTRVWLKDYVEMARFERECEKENRPCFLSVNYYKARDQIYAVEKLFFDFDCAENPNNAFKEALDFAVLLQKYYGIIPFIVFSGHKGYHVYVWLSGLLYVEDVNEAKKVVELLQDWLLMGTEYKTLDRTCLGDIKRLARLPYSIHEKTGNLVKPLNAEKLNKAKEKGIDKDIIQHAIEVCKAPREKVYVTLKKRKKMRPCVLAMLQKTEMSHVERLIASFEMLNLGYTKEEMIEAFSHQKDFNERRTKFYVEYAIRRGYHAYSCAKIQAYGLCLGERCYIYRYKMRTL